MARDIHAATATELATRIRHGDLSPVTVVDAFLDRIAERNDRTNAFVTVCEADARRAAREAERALEDGEEIGRLHGVPVALKDLFAFKAGVRHTFGSRLFEDFVPDRDAIVVERLEAEGAIVLGKTNTPEFGLGTTTDNLVAGPTFTPFDPDRASGGSSGGSAAALADGLTPLAQGSDVGGSLRIPASFCGVVGVMPSFGRVPLTRPLRPNGFAGQTPYLQLGPMARSVEDAALMLDVMAGPHAEDPLTQADPDADYVAATRRSVDDLRVAYTPDLGIFPVSAAVREVCAEAAAAFEAAGASVTRVDPDFPVSQDELLETFYTYVRASWRSVLRNLAQVHDVDPFGEDRDLLRPEFVETLLEPDEDASTVEYKRADQIRTAVFDGLQTVLADYDVLLVPTTGVPPFDPDSPPTRVDGQDIEPLRGWVLTQPCNMSGHPVASVPGGFTDDDLPVGLQIIGNRFRDEDVFAAAGALERVRPWREEYPFA